MDMLRAIAKGGLARMFYLDSRFTKSSLVVIDTTQLSTLRCRARTWRQGRMKAGKIM